MEANLRAAGMAEASHILVACADNQACAHAVADLLRSSPARVLCLIDSDATCDGFTASVAAEWQRRSQSRWSPAVAQRLTFQQWPADLCELSARAAGLAGIDGLVHDARTPAATAHWMLLARRLGVQRVLAMADNVIAAREAERIAAVCGVLAVVVITARPPPVAAQKRTRLAKPRQPQPISTPAAWAC